MKYLHYAISAAIAASLQFTPEAAFAEDIVLDDVLVTAGLDPVEASQVGRAYTVIDGEQLQNSQARYVADALRQVPGIAVSQSGAQGGLTQVRIRGAEGNHVLVLIDGIEVSDVGEGEFNFGSLLVTDIERIEVLRGPQSALWSSNALAGVINIITKPGRRDGFESGIQTEGGTDRSALIGGYVRGGQGWYDLAFSGVFSRTDGFNISDFGSEKDGSNNLSLNFKSNIDVTPELRFNATLRYVTRETDLDGQDFAFPSTPTQGLFIDTNEQGKEQQFSAGIGATLDSFDGLLTQVARLEFTDNTRRNYTDDKLSSANTGDRIHSSYQATVRFDTPNFAGAHHSVTGALEYERENFQQLPPVSNPSQLTKHSRSIFGAIAEYRGEFFDTLSFAAAIRHDENDKFANATTYSLSSSFYIPATDTRIHGSVGTGVTNPSFSEQFGFIPATFTGNPNLKPEKSFAWDIGVEQTFLDGQVTVDITYFNERLENEITTNFVGGGTTPANLKGVSPREGVEVAAMVQVLDNLTVRSSYMYLDAHEPSGVPEVRRPRHSGSLGINYSFAEGRGNAHIDATFNGDMEDLEFINSTPQTRVTLHSYTVVNAGASYWMTDNTQIYGRVENLFNETYEEIFGVNTQGLTAFIGLRVKFGSRNGNT